MIAAVGEQDAPARPASPAGCSASSASPGVNVRAIAQGSSELNVSLVVDRRDEARGAERHPRRLLRPRAGGGSALALAGVGRVGATLLDQLARRRRRARRSRAPASSGWWRSPTAGRMALDGARASISPSWQRAPGGRRPALDPQRLRDRLPPAARASSDPRRLHRQRGGQRSGTPSCWPSGVAVVAANKLAVLGPLERLSRACSRRRAGAALRCCYEATVGAGLPVLSTLADLRRTGDRIERIDGVLSGTVNAVLDGLAAGETFSRAVRAGPRRGPHRAPPLGGPERRRRGPQALHPRPPRRPGDRARGDRGRAGAAGRATGATWTSRPSGRALPRGRRGLRRAPRRGGGRRPPAALRRLADGRAARGSALEAVAPEHPAHGVWPAPTTWSPSPPQRYRDSPLVLRGPGAGPAVTAGGVFADILARRRSDRRGRRQMEP